MHKKKHATSGLKELCRVESVKEATGMTSQKGQLGWGMEDGSVRVASVKEEGSAQEGEHIWEAEKSLVGLEPLKDGVW